MSDEKAATPALSHRPLPAGTRLRNFVVTRYLGEGGFGIVYVATDDLLQREVAIKEYLPAAFATRGEDNAVVPLSVHEGDTFRAGLAGFLEEARLLARFDHPNLVKVLDFWEANGTAYMAMPYYRGVTLRNVLRDRAEPPDEAWLKSLLRPLCEALAEIHAQQCVHRDISPDNILMLGSGQPLLLDFGAARRVIADATQDLTVILKPGFAPIEQYGDSATAKQGPWSDVYALAAVVYFAISKTVPKAAVARIMKDDLERFVDIGAGRYAKRFLEGLDRAMSVRPEARPATIEAFAASIGLDTMPARPGALPVAAAPEPAARPESAAQDENNEATSILPPPADPDATLILERAPGASLRRHASAPDGDATVVLSDAQRIAAVRPATFLPPAQRHRPVWPLVAAIAALAAAVIAGMEMFEDPPTPDRRSTGTAVGTPGTAVPTAEPARATASPPDREPPAASKAEASTPAKAEVPAATNVDTPAPSPDPPRASATPQQQPSAPPASKSTEAARANLPVSRAASVSAKCGEWLARLQLGETLPEQEMALFSRECRK